MRDSPLRPKRRITAQFSLSLPHVRGGAASGRGTGMAASPFCGQRHRGCSCFRFRAQVRAGCAVSAARACLPGSWPTDRNRNTARSRRPGPDALSVSVDGAEPARWTQLQGRSQIASRCQLSHGGGLRLRVGWTAAPRQGRAHGPGAHRPTTGVTAGGAGSGVVRPNVGAAEWLQARFPLIGPYDLTA